MIPVEKIASGTITNLILYLSIISILLFVATILRLKISFLRKAFIPASLIAGILGLALGPYVLGVFSGEVRSSFAAIPTPFTVIVFACMQLGVKHPKMKESLQLAAPSALQAYSYSFSQFGITCLLTALLFGPLWGVNPLFGSSIEVGFMGGHGTAGGMSGIYTDLGWAAGADVGQTTATIGLIVGIFGGIWMINLAAKKRYTTVLEKVGAINISSETYSEETRKPAAYTTVSSDIIESFAFHGALIGIAVFIGQAIVWGFRMAFHYSLPLFPFAMIGGFLLNMVLQRTKLGELMDRATFQRIQGLAMEFLIVAAVSSVSIPVVLEYWQPLLVSCVVLSLTTMGIFWFISPMIYKKHWFECGIVRYGTATGVAAIGLMLLRTVDPEMKTEGGRVYALSTPFTSAFIGGGLVTTAYPLLIANWGALQCGLLFTALSVACILLACTLMGSWGRKPVKEQRGNLNAKTETMN